jgi:hypothetical protein
VKRDRRRAVSLGRTGLRDANTAFHDADVLNMRNVRLVRPVRLTDARAAMLPEQRRNAITRAGTCRPRSGLALARLCGRFRAMYRIHATNYSAHATVDASGRGQK